MARVLKIRQGGHRGSGGGFFTRLHAWLDAFQKPGESRRQTHVSAADGVASAAPAGQVLAFPVRGEALLVTLAGLLRSRIAGQNPGHDLFDLVVLREPSPHLRLDQASYVEFEPGRAVYRLIVSLCPTTALTIETEDFDQIVAFVVEYVNDRLAEFAVVGGPS